MKYKIVLIKKKEGMVELPVGAIPLQIGLTIVKKSDAPDIKLIDRLVDCVKCLVPIEEEG